MCLDVFVAASHAFANYTVCFRNNWDLSGLAADELEWVAANCVAVRVDTTVFAPARIAPALPKPLPKARPSYKRQRAASG